MADAEAIMEAPPGLGSPSGQQAAARATSAWRLVVIPTSLAAIVFGLALWTEGAILEWLLDPLFGLLAGAVDPDDLSILLILSLWTACTITGMVLGRSAWKHGGDHVTIRRGKVSFLVGCGLMLWLAPATLLFLGVVVLNPLLF